MLAETFVDIAFLGTNRVTIERGHSTPDAAEAAGKRAMVRAERRVIVPADHAKFGNDCFARFGDLNQIDAVITDTALDGAIANEFERAGLRLVLV